MCVWCFFFFFKQKAAYEMATGDWGSDVCSCDLLFRSKSGSGGVERVRVCVCVCVCLCVFPMLDKQTTRLKGQEKEKGLGTLPYVNASELFSLSLPPSIPPSLSLSVCIMLIQPESPLGGSDVTSC